MSSRKQKLTRYPYTPIRMAKIQDTTPNAGEYAGQQKLSFCQFKDKKGQATSKYTLTMRSSNRAAWHLLKEAENLRPHKSLHPDVYGCFSQLPKLRSNQSAPQYVNRKINYGASRKWNIIQCQKEMSYQIMKRRGGTLNVYGQVKEDNLKRSHTA